MTSRTKWLAGTLMTLGVVSGLFIGGLAGVILALLCLIAGLGYLGSQLRFTIKANKAQPSEQVQTLLEPAASQTDKEPTEVVVTVKGVHAFSADATPEDEGSQNRKLDLEVFIHAWLVSEAEDAVEIKTCQLKIAIGEGSINAERVAGDLNNWLLDTDKEESDMWDTHFKRVRERLVELNTSKPLECGTPREGWLHFRLRNVSSAEYSAAAMELVVEDSLSAANVATVDCTRYLSGKVERNELGDPPHIVHLEKPVVSG